MYKIEKSYFQFTEITYKRKQVRAKKKRFMKFRKERADLLGVEEIIFSNCIYNLSKSFSTWVGQQQEFAEPFLSNFFSKISSGKQKKGSSCFC